MPGSPFATSKPGLNGRYPSMSSSPGKARIATPRARIPSAVSMPPPASPIPLTTRSISLNDADDRPIPLAFAQSSQDAVTIEALKSRIEALEYDNDRLRSLGSPTRESANLSERLNILQAEKDDAISNLTTLENTLATLRQFHEEAEASRTTLENDVQARTVEANRTREEQERRCAVLQLSLDEHVATLRKLQESLSVKQQTEERQRNLLEKKEQEFLELSSRAQHLTRQLDSEKLELGSQIDELRIAGQVCGMSLFLVTCITMYVGNDRTV